MCISILLCLSLCYRFSRSGWPGCILLIARGSKTKGQVYALYTWPFIPPIQFSPKEDYRFASVWQPGKKVLATILLVCPLVALELGRK
jgi:hypothetical protein